jgi:hypothetical protein
LVGETLNLAWCELGVATARVSVSISRKEGDLRYARVVRVVHIVVDWVETVGERATTGG